MSMFKKRRKHSVDEENGEEAEAYPGGLAKGGSKYYCLLDLFSKVQWVLVELVPLSAVMHSHSNYYM